MIRTEIGLRVDEDCGVSAGRSKSFHLLGVRVSVINLEQAVDRIAGWIEEGRRVARASGRYVCVRDVNGIIESQRDPGLRAIHAEAAMVTPDGMPVVWSGQLAGHRHVGRVYGPDLMLEVCSAGMRRGWRHFLYGGGPGVVDDLQDSLGKRFDGLNVVGSYSPPFRPLTADERRDVIARMNNVRPDLIWVGLSTPKQERFMADIAPEIRGSVLIGVGAAFDFLSGRKLQAPRWIQRSGFEWLFRLATEPRRLWRRYLFNNSLFLALIARELLQSCGGLRARGRADR